MKWWAAWPGVNFEIGGNIPNESAVENMFFGFFR
jgi:hypothetical protein